MRSLVVALMLLPTLIASAADSAFTLPHLDRWQPWQPLRLTSFGSLLTPATELPDDASMTRINLIDALLPTSAVRALLVEQSASEAAEVATLAVARLATDADAKLRANALLEQGIALQADRRFAASLQPLRQVVTLIKRRQGPFSQALITPLSALGLSLQAVGKHEAAADAFSRAQNLVQRLHGTHSEHQLALVLAKAESWRARGEIWQTEQLLRSYLKLVQITHSPVQPAAVAATIRVAMALSDLGQYRDALSLLRSQLLSLTAADGDDSPLMADVMSAMARVFLVQGGAEVDRGKTLSVRAAHLTEKFAAQFSVTERIERQLRAGDWLMLLDRERLAATHYRRAWRLAALSPDKSRWQEQMARPVMIFAGPDVTLDVLGYHWSDAMAYVGFSFDLRRDGRPRRVRVTETNLHTTSVRTAISMFRMARFRPPILDGQTASYPEMTFQRIYDTRPAPTSGLAAMIGVE